MKRREFITLIGGAAATWPFAALAQQSMMPVVALIRDGSAGASTRFVAGFRKGLGETGYVEGQNVSIEYPWLGGRYDRLPAVLAGRVRRRVAVIAPPRRVPPEAAQAATARIPRLFG